MMQDEAMSMSNEQAIQILKPMRDMMRDQRGCPISDAYFAVDKAIHALQTLSPNDVRGVVKVNYEHGDYSCSACGHPARRLSFARKKYCDECGAKLLWEVSEDA